MRRVSARSGLRTSRHYPQRPGAVGEAAVAQSHPQDGAGIEEGLRARHRRSVAGSRALSGGGGRLGCTPRGAGRTARDVTPRWHERCQLLGYHCVATAHRAGHTHRSARASGRRSANTSRYRRAVRRIDVRGRPAHRRGATPDPQGGLRALLAQLLVKHGGAARLRVLSAVTSILDGGCRRLAAWR